MQSSAILRTGKQSTDQRYSGSGGTLPGYRDIGMSNGNIPSNHTGNIKNHNSWTFLCARRVETPWPAGVQIRNLDNTATTTTLRNRPVTFCTGKGR